MMPRNILNVLTDAFDSINANEADFRVERFVHEQTMRITIVMKRPEQLPRAIAFQHHELILSLSREGDVLVEHNSLLSRNGLETFMSIFTDSVVHF